MIEQALFRRRLQFVAGPETCDFDACMHHLKELQSITVSLFYIIRLEPLRPVFEEDAKCYFCRSKDGP